MRNYRTEYTRKNNDVTMSLCVRWRLLVMKTKLSLAREISNVVPSKLMLGIATNTHPHWIPDS
jgi:hypothetical protein